MRNVMLILILVTCQFCIVVWHWYNCTYAQQFARRVKGLPDGEYWGIIEASNDKLLLVLTTVNLRTLQGADRFTGKADRFPFQVYHIDAEKEKVIEQFRSKHWSAIGITAEREGRIDSWMAQDYDFWVVDSQRKLAYATRPKEWTILGIAETFRDKVYVINLNQRKVEAVLNMPEIKIWSTPVLALSPDGKNFILLQCVQEKMLMGIQFRD